MKTAHTAKMSHLISKVIHSYPDNLITQNAVTEGFITLVGSLSQAVPLIQFRKNISLLGYGITRFHCNLTNHYSNTPLNKAEPNTLLTFIDLCLMASNQENSQSDRNFGRARKPPQSAT